MGLTDFAPDAPVIAVREGAASRTFVVDAIASRKPWTDEKWDAAFADVDGDGRTDVVLRLDGTRAGAAARWTQVFLAPPPSVQAQTLAPDLASSFALLDAPDVHAAAALATGLPARSVTRDEACRLIAAASTPAGFRRVASGDARVLRFDQPGLPTWLPKIVPSAKVGADDVRGLGAHCAEMACSPTRPYCSWSGGTDSQHVWFGVHDGDLAICGRRRLRGRVKHGRALVHLLRARSARPRSRARVPADASQRRRGRPDDVRARPLAPSPHGGARGTALAHRPGAIAWPTSTEDVARLVRWAPSAAYPSSPSARAPASAPASRRART